MSTPRFKATSSPNQTEFRERELCYAIADELRGCGAHCRDSAEQVSHLGLKFAFHAVSLFCEAGVSTLHRALNLAFGEEPEHLSELTEETIDYPAARADDDWRPGSTSPNES